MGRFAAAVAALWLAGCGDTTEVEIADSGPVDARPRPLQDGGCTDLEAPLSGDYTIEWECLEGCSTDAPFIYMTAASIGDSEATYSGECGDECLAMDSIQVEGDCFSGDGFATGASAETEPYTVCVDGCVAAGDVAYRGHPGPSDLRRVWRMVLSR